MKKLCLLTILTLLCHLPQLEASYGLNSTWRPIKERVTHEFEQQVLAQQQLLQQSLEDQLGMSLARVSGAQGHYDSLTSADGAFSQCLPGLNCGQYDCMMDQYKCDSTSFLPNFPVRVCKSFEDDINLGRYDENGVLWVYQTTYCLQNMAMTGLLDHERLMTPRCDVVEEQIVDRHEECFFDQETSLCDLSFQNKKAVFQTLIPHGGRFVTKNNRIDWYRVKILWDHFTRCPLRDIFKANDDCAQMIPTSCNDEACLQQFAESLSCLLEK